MLIVRHLDAAAGSVTVVLGNTEGFLENFIELLVVWLFFELQVQNLIGEFLHYVGISAAESVHGVVLFGFSSEFEGLGIDHLGIEVDSR